MPLLNSMGTLRNMAMYPNTIAADYYYFNSLNTKGNAALPTNGYNYLTTINNTLYQFGSTGGSTSAYRPYIVGYTSTDTLSYTKVYSDLPNYNPTGFVIDSAGNQHVLMRYNPGFSATPQFRLLKYDTLGGLIMSKNFAFPVGGAQQRAFSLKIDSSGNLYVGVVYGTSVCVFKIDGSAYTVIWSSNINLSFNSPSLTTFRMHLDGSGNIIVTGRDVIPSTNDVHYCVQFDNSGSFVWGKKFTFGYNTSYTSDSTIDSDNNIYMLMGNYLGKLDSSGTVLYHYTVSDPTGSDLYYSYIDINKLNNLVLVIGGGSGIYVVALNRNITNGGSSTLVSEIDLVNNYDPIDVVCDNNYTYVLNEFNNGSGRVTTSVLKLAPNGRPPTVAANVNFTETVDNGSSYTWTGTISSNSISNVTVSTTSFSTTNLTPTPTTVTLTISNITQSVSATVPIVYNLQLT